MKLHNTRATTTPGGNARRRDGRTWPLRCAFVVTVAGLCASGCEDGAPECSDVSLDGQECGGLFAAKACIVAGNDHGCGLNGYVCKDGKWREQITYCNPAAPEEPAKLHETACKEDSDCVIYREACCADCSSYSGDHPPYTVLNQRASAARQRAMRSRCAEEACPVLNCVSPPACRNVATAVCKAGQCGVSIAQVGQCGSGGSAAPAGARKDGG